MWRSASTDGQGKRTGVVSGLGAQLSARKAVANKEIIRREEAWKVRVLPFEKPCGG